MAVETTQVHEERPLKSDSGFTNGQNGNIRWLVLFSEAFNEQQAGVPQSEGNGADSTSFTRARVGESDDGDGRNVPFVFPLRSQK